MRISVPTRLVLAAALCAAASHLSPAQAQTVEPRCQLVGQMAVSNWLSTLTALAGGSPTEVDPHLNRLSQTVTVYEATGCDQATLAAAMDCLLTASEQADTTREQLARFCMRESGLSGDR
jgi:hypothetical protein